MGYKCIVCGVTGSVHAQQAALKAATLAARDGARLIYVYAADVSFLAGSLMVQNAQGYAEDSLVNMGSHILDHAEVLVKHLGVTPEKLVKRGPPREVLRQVVIEEKADLLVVGHEERTRIERKLVNGEVEAHIDAFRQATGAEVIVVTQA